MKQIIKYLFFVGFLAAAVFAAANFDFAPFLGSKTSKSVIHKKITHVPNLSGKPSLLLTGLTGQVSVDYSSAYHLTVAGSDDLIMVWQLPETHPLHEIDCGQGFKAVSLRFIPASSEIAVGGMMSDNTGSISFFDAATGQQRLQIDEPEPVLFMDPHPNGKYLLVTCETYIKIIDIKDGNSLAILQKSNLTARAYYYDNGQYILQSDSLSLFDLKKRSVAGTLDSVTPFLFKKGAAGKAFAWVSTDGVSVIATAQVAKKFSPIDTKGMTAFDVESNGTWGVFLIDTQKIAVIDLSNGKIIKSIELASPASDITISPDAASVYVHLLNGTVGVYDIGYRNKLKSIQFSLTKMFGTIKSKLKPVAKPEPQ